MAFISKILLFIGAISLFVSLFFPIWQISLLAPQYSNGLLLEIYANKLDGEVNIINGLNHYVGMKKLATEDFIEFKILPFIILFFTVLFLINIFLKSKKILTITLISFILFGIISIIDFWKWEYDYGHNLDPNAAIKMEGASFQPPLFGYKKLLNFGVYSVPDIGGMLFILSGLLLFIAFLIEKKLKIFYKIPKLNSIFLIFFSLLLFSCSTIKNPEPINLNKDACTFCKMTISDLVFASELITDKGRIYKFDDIFCLKKYLNENQNLKNSKMFSTYFANPTEFIEVNNAFFIKHDDFKSPMGGNIISLKNKLEAETIGHALRFDEL